MPPSSPKLKNSCTTRRAGRRRTAECRSPPSDRGSRTRASLPRRPARATVAFFAPTRARRKAFAREKIAFPDRLLLGLCARDATARSAKANAIAGRTSMIPERGKIRFRKLAIALFATLAALAELSPAAAQPYPNRAIKLVVPYSAGSGADITARQTMAKLSGILGQNIVIENRPGASGMTGTDSVARAAPDGYTLLFGVTQHAINPGLYRKLPYDTLADFAAVARVTSQPLFLGVPTSLPAKFVAELVDYVKARPGKLNYASSGIGTSIHLAGAFFAFKAALEMSHVPYTNASQAIAEIGRAHV